MTAPLFAALAAAPAAAAETPPAPGWQTREMVSSFHATSADSPTVAANAAGDALLAWGETSGSGNRIWGRAYSATSGWSTSTLVETGSIQSSFGARVAIDPYGDGLAVWNQFTGAHYDVWAARYTTAAGWAAPVLLESESTYDSIAVDVALGSDGHGASTWEQDNGTFFDIWASLFDPVTGWSSPALLESGNAGDAYGPRVAIDGDGVVTVAWYQNGASNSEVVANRFTPGTGWSGATPLSAAAPNDADAVRVASSASGGTVVVWEQGNGTGIHIFADHWAPGSGWEGATQIEDYDYGGIVPDVTMDDSGRAVAAWMGLDGTHALSTAATFDPSTGWGPATDILPDTGTDQYSVQVSASPAGPVTAVWVQDTGGRRDVWASRYLPGAGWQSSELIERDNGGDPSYVFAASDGAGNAFATWAQSDGVQYVAWAARYIAPDTTAPQLVVSEPADGTHVNGASVRVSGISESTATVTVDGVQAAFGYGATFSLLVPLEPGANTVVVTASDPGGSTVVTRQVFSDTADSGLSDELNATKADLADTQAELAATQAGLAAAQANLSATQVDLATAQSNLVGVHAEVNALSGQVDDLGTQLAAANAKAAAAQSNVTDLSGRVNDLETAPAGGGDIVPLLVAVVALVVGGLAVMLSLRGGGGRPAPATPAQAPAAPAPTSSPPDRGADERRED